jgi:two-component system, response regulator FlrC
LEKKGYEKMTIIIIDSQVQREQAIRQELIRAGWLVSELDHQDAALAVTINSINIAIVLDPAIAADFARLNNNGHTKLTIIGYVPDNQASDHHLALDIELLALDKYDRLIQDILKKVTQAAFRSGFPLTCNQHMQDILHKAFKVAGSQAPVLVLGETGTGKEMIAQYIHCNSKQMNGPFIAVNCAAIPETMIEAILFGYEKGAFTNAINQYIGKFERAHHGTLFLDEIGEMSLDLQSKLLRVLQTNEIERLGGKDSIKVDVRVIAATNKNLISQMQKGLFRQDLYYRINVIQFNCPALRERREDIKLLAHYFAAQYAQEINKNISLDASAIFALGNYAWPGNVRELQNVMQRAVIMNENGVITEQDIVFDEMNRHETSWDSFSVKSREAEEIVNVLRETNGCRSDAAKKLMISPRTLRYKISKLKDVGYDVPRSQK